MKKEKWYIVNVESLEHWAFPETSDSLPKEYIVKAPDRETAIRLTRKHLIVKEKKYIYSEDIWGHDILIIDPSINKESGAWTSISLQVRHRDKKGKFRYKSIRIILFASTDSDEYNKFLRQYLQDNNIDWVKYFGGRHSCLQGVLKLNEQ